MKTLLNNHINQFNHILTVVKENDVNRFGGFYSFTKYVAYMVDLLAEDLQENAGEYVANYENIEYYKTHEEECIAWDDLTTIVNNVHHDLTSNDLNKYMDAMDYLLIVKPFDLID